MFNEFILTPFVKSAYKFKDHNAFCINEKYFTYKKLAEEISKIRIALQGENLLNKIIGLVVNDDIETYASIFAIWLEGFAYLPLSPNQPIKRSIEILSQAKVSLIIDSENCFPSSKHKVINSRSLEFSEVSLELKKIPDDFLVYILFTSGSTGKPKGVPITRKNLSSFVKSFLEVGFEIDYNDRCLQCFDLTFDVSVQSFLIPLLKGACVYTIPHDQIKYSYIYGLFEEHRLTFAVLAPSMLRYLRPYFNEIKVKSLKYCIVTAEASPVDLLMEWSYCIPKATVYDFYGPTEATIYCTYNLFNKKGKNKHLNGMLSIGKPMNGFKAIIIDERGNSLGVNKKGELCISGDQLTPGYWENSQKSEESFFEKEWMGKSRRFYKTGDYCSFESDGSILLSGRIDYQVKIQGYRIELGEIEYHAREYLLGQNTVALTFKNKTGNTEIALCIEGELASTKNLLTYLKAKMPYYMVPTKIISEKEFPLNSNGKTDRIALKKEIGL